MRDKSLILDALENIEQSLNDVLEWTTDVHSVYDFLTSPSGMILLNAVCMKLWAVGEEIKRTDKKLFTLYSAINWKEAMKMRDVIAHHYFDIDAEIVFSTLSQDVQPLLQTIKQIKGDLTNDRIISDVRV